MPVKKSGKNSSKKSKATSSTLAINKRVTFDYEILQKFETGIELTGIEVKSTREHHTSLVGAHVSIRGGEAFLLGADIAPYQVANTPENYDPKRARKLLLKKSEIAELAALEAKKGLTIVPISMYCKGPKIKVEIAIVRGKKQFDKRESTKKRDTDREIRREFAI